MVETDRVICILVALLLLATGLAAGCVAEEPAAEDTVMNLLAGDERFTTMTAALRLTGKNATLAGEGPFTVFAPTDEAFAQVPPETVARLFADPQGELTGIVDYHIVPRQRPLSDLRQLNQVMTLQDRPAQVVNVDATVEVAGARVIDPDMRAGNGIVHAVDAVMMPPPPGPAVEL